MMLCEQCNGRMSVLDSRAADGTEGTVTRRRRGCDDCGNRITTYELPCDDIPPTVGRGGGVTIVSKRDARLLEKLKTVLKEA